jgi:predicted O-methyltransferase YrrM
MKIAAAPRPFNPSGTFNPLRPLGHGLVRREVTRSALADVVTNPTYREMWDYFAHYPSRSLMSGYSRWALFALVRMMQAQSVAEVGTLFAGTTEVFARALWENGAGEIHTADPFGNERCPEIIAAWPPELQRHARYYPLNSMDFFLELGRQRVTLDLALIDGNHDFEFALFDLQMAARLLRPGGIIVMDNAEQTGPFEASRAFIDRHPAWSELGSAIADYSVAAPFDATRTSLPGTTFIVLRSPECVSIGLAPHAWQMPLRAPFVGGLVLDMQDQPSAGLLHYRVYARGFADGNQWIREKLTTGAIRIGAGGSLSYRFPEPLAFDPPAAPCQAVYNVEIELSWTGDAPLNLSRAPAPLES